MHVHNAFCDPQNIPTSPANLPEHEAWIDNGTKTLGDELSGTALKYKKVPTVGEGNKTIESEVGLFCVQPLESSLATLKLCMLN